MKYHALIKNSITFTLGMLPVASTCLFCKVQEGILFPPLWWTIQDLYWFRFPKSNNDIKITHCSYFENWDPYRNYLIAKNKYNLQDIDAVNTGTFTNFAQNDQALTHLHYYLMYLKFGFGRATQDAGIEIRRGAMTRESAINLVKMYDGIFPEEHVGKYLEYFNMKESEFFSVIDDMANRELFEKSNKGWIPKFDIDKIWKKLP